MKYFFDTEFIEHKGGIDLISIGIVSEDGREFYGVSKEFKKRKADKWVRDNVLPNLPERYPDPYISSPNQQLKALAWMSLKDIKRGIISFVGNDREPQFVAYYADYDWVVFARLFGRLMDLPGHFPMWCIDLRQMMWERGLDTVWQQNKLPVNSNEHDALEDAKWNEKLYIELVKLPLKGVL